MKTYLVTGGAGFIGSNFVLKCRLAWGVRVVNLDKLTYAGNPGNLAPLAGDPFHIFVRGDIGDRNLTRSLLREWRPEAVVNFAAESHVDRSIDGPEEFIRTNVVATFHLLEEVRRYWMDLESGTGSLLRFLHVSTDEVYGSLLPNDPPFTEKNAYLPNSPYAASKASSDHLVRAYLHTYGFPALTTNCSNNYGPMQFPEKLIPLMILNILRGKALPVYGKGLNVRDWLYVEDHCDAIQAVIERGRLGETYNIGGCCERANIDVVRAICENMDRLLPTLPCAPSALLIRYVNDRPGHDLRYAVDCAKIKAELGWQPKETFESGLEKTIRWYLENPKWIESIDTGAYRDWIEKKYGNS